MSGELEKRVAGEWFDLREAAGDPTAAAKAAGLSAADLRAAAARLRSSVEGGILEFKRSVLRSVIAPLGSLAHDSRALSGIGEGARGAGSAAWCCLQQRRIALGRVPVQGDAERAPDGSAGSQAAEAEAPLDPASVFEDVKQLFAERPEAKNSAEGKMIVLQLKQYRQEMAKLKELLEKIPEEKRKPLRENFAYRLREILRKVRQGCEALSAPPETADRGESEGPVLARVDEARLAAMAKRFMQEAELFSRIRSVLLFAADEKFRSRQSLLALERVAAELESTFTLEAGDYRTLAPFGDGEKRVADEMARLVRKIAEECAGELEYRGG